MCVPQMHYLMPDTSLLQSLWCCMHVACRLQPDKNAKGHVSKKFAFVLFQV